MTSERPGELVLVRHGETEWSKSGQHTGRTDIPLTENGVAQAERAGRFLADRTFALALSSPLQRARDTAGLVGVDPELDEDLLDGTTAPTRADHPADQGAATRTVGPLDRRGPRRRHPGRERRRGPGPRRAHPGPCPPVLAEGQDAIVVAHGTSSAHSEPPGSGWRRRTVPCSSSARPR